MSACGPTLEEGEDMSNRRYDQDNQRWYESPAPSYALGGADSRDVNLGWETVINPPKWSSGDQSLIQLSNKSGPEVLLLDVNLEDALGPDRYASAGSLVLSLSAEITKYGGTPVSYFLTPLVARVQLGAGGVIIESEVDALRAVIPVHSPQVRVTVFYQSIFSNNSLNAWLAGIESKVLPEEVRIRGTIQRSFSAGNATRTYYADTDNGPWPVPPYSKCFSIQSGELFADVEANNGFFIQRAQLPTGAGFALDSILEANAFARFVKNSCCRKTSPGASDIQIGGDNNRRLTLIHTLGF